MKSECDTWVFEAYKVVISEMTGAGSRQLGPGDSRQLGPTRLEHWCHIIMFSSFYLAHKLVNETVDEKGRAL